jgi:hypothetical protein
MTLSRRVFGSRDPRFSAFVPLSAIATVFLAPAFPDGKEVRQKLVAEISERGGYVRVDQDKPGSPVVGLVLQGPGFADPDLKRYVQAFPELGSVGISSPAVSDAGLSALKESADLVGLIIRSRSIDGSFLAALVGLPRLMSVEMRCPRLSGVALKHLAAIPTLRIAILDCSGLRDADLGELKRSRIEALTLNRASFSGAALTALEGMPNLIELGIYDIDLGNDGAAVLHGFDRLRRLTLGGERITDGGLKPLTGLRVLRELDLVDTTLTEPGIEAIKRALPKAQITLRRSKPGER